MEAFFAGRQPREGSALELTEAQAAPEYDAGGAEQHCGVQARVAVGGQHYLHDAGVQLLLWDGAAAGAGFGFILDQAGHVLTNFHVVEGANRGIKVMLSNKQQLRRQGDRHGQGARPGAAADRCAQPRAGDAGRLRRPGGGTEGLCDRQSVWAERDDDARNHQLDPVDYAGRKALRLRTQSRRMRRSIQATRADHC